MSSLVISRQIAELSYSAQMRSLVIRDWMVDAVRCGALRGARKGKERTREGKAIERAGGREARGSRAAARATGGASVGGGSARGA